MPNVQATALLLDIQRGGPETIAALFPYVYDELQRLARSQLRRERADHTLNTSALVHEAYLKLIDQREMAWQNKAHFCALAARAMRQILIDHARKHNAAKRGHGQRGVTLEDHHGLGSSDSEQLLALDEALTMLGKQNERMARVVECRFFGGMNMEETATALGTSKRTVEREWTRAKAYLAVMLEDA